MAQSSPLVSVADLKKHFQQGRRSVKAVDGVSLDIYPGETVGLVGESGCGKSTLGRTILGLYTATSGSVTFEGRDLLRMAPREWGSMRTKLQIVFQDPGSSLNPIMSIGKSIQDALAIHGVGSAREQHEEVERLLDQVGIGRQFYDTFPYEMSVGQQQRVAIARAIALRPRFVVCDEPISSLDLSIQGQIIDLLLRLQQEYGLAYLFISHDLRVVQFLSRRIYVMYLGRIVEYGSTDAVYSRAAHPYSRALLSAVPEIASVQEDGAEAKRERIVLAGEPPSPINPPPGCPFHPRCPSRLDVCDKAFPPVTTLEPGHSVVCWLYCNGKSISG